MIRLKSTLFLNIFCSISILEKFEFSNNLSHHIGIVKFFNKSYQATAENENFLSQNLLKTKVL